MVNNLPYCGSWNGIIRFCCDASSCMEYGRLIYGSNGNHELNCDYTSWPIAYAALTDYVRQKKQGKDPVFSADSIPGLTNTECWDKPVVTDKEKAV